MNVGHGRPRFQNVKLISCGSTSCNFFKYLSLASLDCKLSKYLDKNNSGRLSRRFRCAYFRYHFLLKLSKQLEVVLQLAHSKCGHRRGNGSIESGENNWTHIPASLPTLWFWQTFLWWALNKTWWSWPFLVWPGQLPLSISLLFRSSLRPSALLWLVCLKQKIRVDISIVLFVKVISNYLLRIAFPSVS